METFTVTKGDKHPTDIAMLLGARFVTANETEKGRPWAEARIKQMTGGDPITARLMHKDFFTYRPTFKLTLVGEITSRCSTASTTRSAAAYLCALHAQAREPRTVSSRKS